MIFPEPAYFPQAEECCTEKMVGDVSYSLLSEDFNGSLPSQCLNGCVYTKTGKLSPKFCFAREEVDFVGVLITKDEVKPSQKTLNECARSCLSSFIVSGPYCSKNCS